MARQKPKCSKKWQTFDDITMSTIVMKAAESISMCITYKEFWTKDVMNAQDTVFLKGTSFELHLPTKNLKENNAGRSYRNHVNYCASHCGFMARIDGGDFL